MPERRVLFISVGEKNAGFLTTLIRLHCLVVVQGERLRGFRGCYHYLERAALEEEKIIKITYLDKTRLLKKDINKING